MTDAQRERLAELAARQAVDRQHPKPQRPVICQTRLGDVNDPYTIDPREIEENHDE